MHAEEGEPQPFSLPEPTYAGAAASHVGSFFVCFLVCGALVHTVHRIHRHSTSRVGAQILALRSTLTPSNTLPQRTQRMGRPGLQSRLRARPSCCARCRVRRVRYLFNAADPPPCDWFGYFNHAHASARASMRVELLLAFLMISSRIASCACSALLVSPSTTIASLSSTASGGSVPPSRCGSLRERFSGPWSRTTVHGGRASSARSLRVSEHRLRCRCEPNTRFAR
jgi:hypothetical protein